MSETIELDTEFTEEARYLLFRLGGECYGTPLLGVREVVEPQEPTPVPNTVRHFAGVINIRGEVVGVIDLRARMGHAVTKSTEMALMVFDTPSGPMAGLVDKVEAVAKIPEKDIERKPNVQSRAPIEFLLGIARQKGRLVTLIDLNKTLAVEELRSLGAGVGGSASTVNSI